MRSRLLLLASRPRRGVGRSRTVYSRGVDIQLVLVSELQSENLCVNIQKGEQKDLRWRCPYRGTRQRVISSWEHRGSISYFKTLPVPRQRPSTTSTARPPDSPLVLSFVGLSQSGFLECQAAAAVTNPAPRPPCWPPTSSCCSRMSSSAPLSSARRSSSSSTATSLRSVRRRRSWLASRSRALLRSIFRLKSTCQRCEQA